MKTLIILFLLLFAVSCVETRSQEIEATASNQWCRHLQRSGYDIDAKGCDAHMESPTFKTGSIVEIRSEYYDDECRFQVRGPRWSFGNVLNKPYYEGDIYCPNIDGKLELLHERVDVMEEDIL